MKPSTALYFIALIIFFCSGIIYPEFRVETEQISVRCWNIKVYRRNVLTAETWSEKEPLIRGNGKSLKIYTEDTYCRKVMTVPAYNEEWHIPFAVEVME